MGRSVSLCGSRLFLAIKNELMEEDPLQELVGANLTRVLGDTGKEVNGTLILKNPDIDSVALLELAVEIRRLTGVSLKDGDLNDTVLHSVESLCRHIANSDQRTKA